jgi:regulatory protein YycI of two-component signal transduction system YycFG
MNLIIASIFILFILIYLSLRFYIIFFNSQKTKTCKEILRNTKKEEICAEKVRLELLAGKKPERCGISPIGKTFSLRHKELLISR